MLLFPPAPLEKDDLLFNQQLFAVDFPVIGVLAPHVLYLCEVPDQVLLFSY
jgi:hypothetical protein